MLEKMLKMIEAAEGLTVNFKFGVESELVIKGNFLDMIKLTTTLMEERDRENRNAEIEAKNISDLLTKIEEKRLEVDRMEERLRLLKDIQQDN